MNRKVLLAVMLLVGCGDDGDTHGNVVLSTSFTLSEASGTGTSPLDGLVNQTIAFSIELAEPMFGHESDPCPTTVHASAVPIKMASGDTATTVDTQILALLPDWDVTLAVCPTASQSSVTLHSDNEGGMAVIVGCFGVPASAQVKDGDGNPRFTTFTATSCDSTVYDQLHGRLFMGHDFSMMVTY